MAADNRTKQIAQWVLALMVLSLGSYLVDLNATQFQASVLTTPSHAAPFNGLVPPIQESPIWTSLTTDEYKESYDQIPQNKMQLLPTYDASTLKTPVEQLGWTSPTDLAIRNAKITYSTPYMGDYKLDGIEGAGSHLAVDIKVPMNTPIYAIGNGVVVTVSTITSGFGTHIVIRHDNFPSYGNPNVLTTYYSSYNHLSQALVGEGQVVTKGELIGYSGETGDATAPHLHFQIDNDTAPWHPYWPFTYQQAVAAGYDMTSAVNAGLGRDVALATTINPLMYVQEYENSSGVSASASASVPASNAQTAAVTTPASAPTPAPVINPAPVVAPTPTPVPSPTPATTGTAIPYLLPNQVPVASTPTPYVLPNQAPPQQISQNTPPVSQSPDVSQQAALEAASTVQAPVQITDPPVGLQVQTNSSFVVGVPESVTINAVDAAGNIVNDYHPSNGIALSVENGGASFEKSFFSGSDVNNGSVETTFTSTGPQGLRVKASDGTISGESNILESQLFADINSNNALATELTFLKNYNVVSGYPDGTFQPDQVVSRVEALKFILKGVNAPLQSVGRLPFTDTDSTAWYANYLATAVNSSIVGGYSDLTFKPAQTVNRVEFLKMLLLAMNVKVSTSVPQDVFSDVPKDAWYAPYVQYAKDKNLIDSSSSTFGPEQGMTRGEVADIIYRMIVLKLSGQTTYVQGLVVSSSQADAYFKNAG